MKRLVSVAFAAAIVAAGGAQATVYTSDGNLADFTPAGINYATLSNFTDGDVGSPYTPTTASLNTDARVFSWTDGPHGAASLPDTTNNYIVASFASATNSIRVFPNIDHPDFYDGYQYTIWGQNKDGSWTELFDATGTNGSGPFTLSSWTGTAPTRVNNVLTPGTGPYAGGGVVGYIADFTFSNAYSVYAFGTSYLGEIGGNTEQELSAVASMVPEPATWAMMILGVGLIGAAARRRSLVAA